LHPEFDVHALEEGREVARVLSRQVRVTIPSVLATGESFSLHLTVFGADGMPTAGQGELVTFGLSPGVTGLPSAVRLDPACQGMTEITGLTAVGPDYAQVRCEIDGLAISSNPAWIFRDPPYRVYWGDLHIHTRLSNCQQWSCKSPTFGYLYARDAAHLDFAAAADHLRGIASEPDRWDELQRCVRLFDEPGRFVPFLAFESSHKTGMGGDINAYYQGLEGPYFWVDREDMKGNSPSVSIEDLWAFLDATQKRYLTIPHHTGRGGKYRSFDDRTYDPGREPLFEIYSAWGSSEMHPSRYPLAHGHTDRPAYFVDALRAGCRYGVIASSDDHTTMPGGETRNWGRPCGPQALAGYHHKGLAAVRATALDRNHLWEAMVARNTYGTTYARNLIDVRMGVLTMGQQAAVSPRDPLWARRRITVRFSLEDPGEVYAVLMRNGQECQRKTLLWNRPQRPVEEVSFEDPEPLDRIAIRQAVFFPDPFVVYYVRLEMPNGQTQWTSPIWLDL
jgi:hypothetical protein